MLGTSVSDKSPLECLLYEEGNPQPIARDNKSLDPSSNLANFELKWTPTGNAPASAPSGGAGPASKADVRKLRLEVTPIEGEAVLEDNKLGLRILVNEPRVRVLYVEGTMRPEYKDLKRVLEMDPNLQAIEMVQVQPRRFWAQGAIGKAHLMGLPATDSDFGLFDVIILGDLDSTYFTHSQIDKLVAFVNRGGGLLMIGGHNSFGPGGFGATRLQEVIPVEMGGRAMPQEFTPFLPQLTAEGEGHSIFEGIKDYFPGTHNRKPDTTNLVTLPDLLGCVTVGKAKPAATVLAVHPTRATRDSGPLVVLAVQSVGSGRCAAFTADTTWQWNRNDRIRQLGKDSPYQRFWGQMIRYLANVSTKSRNAGTQTFLRMDRQYMLSGQSVDIKARVQDDRQPPKPVSVQCTIIHEDPAVANKTVTLSPTQEDKVFSATWRPEKPGNYRIKLAVADASSKDTLGIDELPMTVAQHQAEMDRLARDQGMLDEISRQSNGRSRDIMQLPQLIDELIHRQELLPGAASGSYDLKLYNFPLLFILFVALMTTEWLLRRSWQLH